MLAALIDLRQVGWTVHLLHDLYTVLWSFPALRFALVATFLVAPIGVVHAATISIPSGSSQQSDTNLYQLRYLDQQRDPVHRWHLRGRVRLCCAALRLGRASFETHTSRVEKVTVTPRNVLAADADHRRHRLSSARLVFLGACPTSDRRGTDGPVHNVCDHCLVVCDGIYRVGEKWFMRGVQFSQGSRLSGGSGGVTKVLAATIEAAQRRIAWRATPSLRLVFPSLVRYENIGWRETHPALGNSLSLQRDAYFAP